MKNLFLMLTYLLIVTSSAHAQKCQDLLLSVKNEDYEQVKKLLKTVDPNCFYDGKIQPRTPLGMAAAKGNLDLGKLLIENGAKATYRYKRDASALMIASQKGDYNFSKYLIANGAKVNRKIDGDGTPLISAVRGGNKSIVSLLLKKGADPNVDVTGDGNAIMRLENMIG